MMGPTKSAQLEGRMEITVPVLEEVVISYERFKVGMWTKKLDE
jgi:hypothetical protein